MIIASFERICRILYLEITYFTCQMHRTIVEKNSHRVYILINV